jgi:hypothetical protein
MLKVVEFLVEAGFWLMAFASPMLVSIIASALIYSSNKSVSIIILIVGVITGIAFAEWVRRKHGCSNYFAKLIASPDINETKDNSENEQD